MNRIRLLPEQIANQIAAGEVVERPMSVVKELVENALDAQATRITIEIQAGGRSLIRVTDDGIGMSRDDALLCLERHATSKIQRAEDLGGIRSLGFRGEALPSIASVSRFSLTTREREFGGPDGTQVILQGGKLVEVKSAGSAVGTTVEVRQLFYNVPARRKFLRSEETERAHVQHYLSLAALAYPAVGFTLKEGHRLIWQLPPIPNGPSAGHESLKERLRALYGLGLGLLAVDYAAQMQSRPSAGEDRSSLLRVWGFIGAPGVSRSTREDQHLFVNRRPIENRGLNYALLEGYHTALMKGRYPVGCLFLELEPEEVDVNVHPAKREIKFYRENAVRQIVSQAVRKTLLDFHTRESTGRPPKTSQLPVETTAVSPSSPLRTESELILPIPKLPQHALARTESPEPAPAPAKPDQAKPPVCGPSIPISAPRDVGLGSEPVPLLNVPLRQVGVIGNLYVVLESDRGLVLLDQHAAHERVLFEQMLRRLEQEESPSQRLLLPETVELSARDAEFLREQLSTLTRLGVGLSEFGERTFLLDALPPFVKLSDARRFMIQVIDELKAAGPGVNSLRLGEATVAKTVCRHAVKAHDPLSGPEREKLVDDLRACAMPYTCPHGRPTILEISYRELEKKFGRIQ